MDKTIRRNTDCVIGMPRCDFVFSSTRACFIAYAFEDSHLEMTILKGLLQKRGIQPEEAAGKPAPGQNAFCAKICSKIITSQFCIAIVNNTEKNGIEIPNANVNMEYGLMLGFNKYVIPFQKASQKLPFNTAPLDTVKYTNADFERLAAQAIDVAIEATSQDAPPAFSPDQIIQAFLLAKRSVLAAVQDVGTRNVYQIGAPLGFVLAHDFSASDYMYFGNFTALRPELIVWRVKTLAEIVTERRSASLKRATKGSVNYGAAVLFDGLMSRVQIWILVTTAEDKAALCEELKGLPYRCSVFCFDDIQMELESIGQTRSAAPQEPIAAEAPEYMDVAADEAADGVDVRAPTR